MQNDPLQNPYSQADNASLPQSYQPVTKQMRREMLARQANEDAYRRRSAEIDAAPEYRGRGGCLTAWLILLWIAVAVVSLSTLASVAAGATDNLILVPFVILVAIALSAIWRMHKWGYFLMMILYGCVFVFEILQHPAVDLYFATLRVAYIEMAITLTAAIILSALVLSRWSEFDVKSIRV